MGIDSLTQTIWAKMLLAAYERKTVYAGICNRDFQGEARMGRTVVINTVGNPTISSYSGGSISWEGLNTAPQSLLIDQGESFAFMVEDIDEAWAVTSPVPKSIAKAGEGLALAADEYIAGLYTAIHTDNDLGVVAITTADLAYQYLVELSRVLDEADVPESGRWCIVPPWYYALLRRNTLFLENAATQGQTLRNGQVGQVLGLDVMMSNSCPLISGDDYAVTAGVQDAIAYADGLDKVETLRLQDYFADGTRGFHVYGSKVVNNKGFALLRASKS